MITAQILEQAGAGELAPLRALPKADLHCHLALSAPFAFYQSLSATVLEPPPFEFQDFPHFQNYLRQAIFPLFKTPGVLPKLLNAALTHMRADGVVYTETSFDISLAMLAGVSWAELAQQFQEVLQKFPHLNVWPELGMARDCPAEFWLKELQPALATGFFRGVDLYGFETHVGAQEFAQLFAAARSQNLKIKLHTGEFGDPAQMRQEIELVAPHALQHGVRMVEDEILLAELARSAVYANVCPTSNIKLGVAPSLSSHPIRKMYDAGVCVTLASDDYAIFGQSVSEEYLALYQAGVFSAAELEKIRENGLRAASK